MSQIHYHGNPYVMPKVERWAPIRGAGHIGRLAVYVVMLLVWGQVEGIALSSMDASDARLVGRWLRTRDPEAFRELAARYGGMVYAACCRVLGNAADAEDAAQDCFLALARTAKVPEHHLGPWLHRTATHRALDLLKSETRRKNREARYIEQRASAEGAPVGEDPAWREIVELVDQAIAELPERLRIPVVEHFLENRSHAEIAQSTGVSRQTVTYRIGKGVEDIRALLRRRGVVVGVTALAGLMASNLAHASPTPPSLIAGLGKIALAGSGSPALAPQTYIGWVSLAKLAVAAVVVVAVAICAREFLSPTRKPVGNASEDSRPTLVSAVPAANAPGPRENAAENKVDEQTPSQQEMPGAASDDCLIEGTIIDGRSGARLPNVGVALSGPFRDAGEFPTGWKGTRKRSGQDGTFRYEGLQPGQYLLRADDPVYVADYPQVTVLLRTTDKASAVELPVRPGAVVTGHVTDKDTGEGIPGIRIRGSSSYSSAYPTRESGVTDDQGTFRITGLGQSDYSIDVAGDFDGTYVPPNDGNLPEDPFRRRITTVAGCEYQADFQLKKVRYATLSGTVVNESGEPVPDVSLSAGERLALVAADRAMTGHIGFGRAALSSKTGVDGTFSIRLPLHSGWCIQAKRGDEISELCGPVLITEEAVKPITLTLGSGASIAGSVLNDGGEPVTGIDIWMDDLGIRGTVPMPVGRTNDNGEFRLIAMPAGDYALWAMTEAELFRGETDTFGPFSADPDETLGFLERRFQVKATRVAIQHDDHTQDIRITCANGGSHSIKGYVVNGRGEPIKHASVTVEGPLELPPQESTMGPPSGKGVDGLRCRAFRGRQLGEDWEFELSGLLPGTYRVMANHWPFNMPAELPSVPADATDVRIVLREMGSIEGRVLDAKTNQPVRLFEIATKEPNQPLDQYNTWNHAWAVYDEDGQFRAKSRTSGRVDVCVRASGYVPQTVRVYIDPEQTLGDVTVALTPSARIEGRVVDPAGKPVPSAAVFLGGVPRHFGQPGYERIATTYTGSNGEFTIANRSSATTIVSVAHPDYAPAVVAVQPDRSGVARAEIILDPGGAIEGVTDPRNGEIIMLSISPSDGLATARTTNCDSQGRFVFTHVPPGIARITAGPITQDVEVVSGQTTALEFGVTEGDCAIEGSVTVGSRTVLQGEVRIAVETPEGVVFRRTEIRNGYHIESLPSGPAHVQVLARDVNDHGARIKELSCELSLGQTLALDVDLGGSGVLSGQVLGQNPDEWVGVVAWPGAVDVATLPFDLTCMDVLAAVNPDGSFELDTLEPGTYTVFALVSSVTPDPQDDFLARYSRQASAVVAVQSGATTVVTLGVP